MYNLLISIAFTLLCLDAVIVRALPADLEAGLQDTNEQQYLGQFVQEQDQDANEQKSLQGFKVDDDQLQEAELQDADEQHSLQGSKLNQLQKQDQLSHEIMQVTGQKVEDDLATEEGEDDLATEEGEDDLAIEEGEDDLATEEGEDDLATEEGEDDLAIEEGEDDLATEEGEDDLATDQDDEDMEANEQAGMRVMFAYYGVRCARGSIKRGNQIRSTNYAGRLCNSRTSCRGRISNSVLSDPYRGCHKDFIVVARCSNGKIIADLVHREGRYFSLKCC